jgi:arabinose-5-phosphate isomerase
LVTARQKQIEPEVETGRPHIDSALRTLAREQSGLLALADALNDGLGRHFDAAIDLVRNATGRVIVTGIGKSGHIGKKIAATFASTGTPSFFVHAAEAGHGDLGMVTKDDVIVALSWSGETQELTNIIEYSRRFRIPLVAVTSNAASALGRQADIVLALPLASEACPHGLAPTTSTLMQLALGDALAVALLEARAFTREDFRAFHPGGKLGASLHLVRDLMHEGAAMPLAPLGTRMSEAIVRISEKGFGCLGITDAGGKLVGIITDGDLRRHLGPKLLDQRVDEVMTRSPRTIPPTTLAGATLEMMNSAKKPFTAIFVVDEEGSPVGIVHLHDLLRIGVA